MSPSVVTIDATDDWDMTPVAPKSNGNATSPQRVLLLAPPSVAAHEEKLRDLFRSYDRSTTDLQMLDRLSAGFVSLPPNTYHSVLLLTDTDGTRRTEALQHLSRAVYSSIVPAMKTGAKLRTQDGYFGASETREAILSGLVETDGAFEKVDDDECVAVPLKLGGAKKNSAVQNGLQNGIKNGTKNGISNGFQNGFKNGLSNGLSNGLQIGGQNGFQKDTVMIDTNDLDDLDGFDDDDDDDDLIDEDTILTEEDMKRPIQQPPECQPKPGQRRRACKDCTCGLAERLQSEDDQQRAESDQKLNALKLQSDDLNELDFTVKGKTGSCGSCALGDGFRCAGCPYLGLPPFKPGEEVQILNNIPQL